MAALHPAHCASASASASAYGRPPASVQYMLNHVRNGLTCRHLCFMRCSSGGWGAHGHDDDGLQTVCVRHKHMLAGAPSRKKGQGRAGHPTVATHQVSGWMRAAVRRTPDAHQTSGECSQQLRIKPLTEGEQQHAYGKTCCGRIPSATPHVCFVECVMLFWQTIQHVSCTFLQVVDDVLDNGLSLEVHCATVTG
jgi:hypothetical protein